MRLFILALLTPTAALAHAGDHSHGFAASITHALTQPDHLAIALGVLALGYGPTIWPLRLAFWRWAMAFTA